MGAGGLSPEPTPGREVDPCAQWYAALLLDADRQEALRQRLRELAAVRVRFGYRRLTVLLKREGWRVNAKRIYRLYCDEGLTVRTNAAKTARQPYASAAARADAPE